MPQVMQSKAFDVGDAITIYADHTADMTGWTLVATMRDSSGNLISANTRTPTIGTGPNGAGTRATIDYTDGTSQNLAAGYVMVYVDRTDAGFEGLKGKIRLRVEPR